MPDLTRLAKLIQHRNNVDSEIAALIGRPPHTGHIAEYVAAAIFGIALHPAASTKASDGHFRARPLAGRSVNIKYGSRRHGMLNLIPSDDPAEHPDLYLVLTGPSIGPRPSRGRTAPWVIHAVYLFVSQNLLRELSARGKRPGIATGLRRELWEAAMIFPEPRNPRLELTDRQRSELRLFRGEATIPLVSNRSG